jgi:hypothetical protein
LGSAQEKSERGRSGPRAGEKAGRPLAGRDERWAENRKKMIFLFFPFLIFQSQFSKDFQIHFEFDLIHSIQNFKCSSMNAQSCFYTYI